VEKRIYRDGEPGDIYKEYIGGEIPIHQDIYRKKGKHTSKQIKENEGELELTDKEKGIFHAYILMTIINRLMTLHRRTQIDMARKSKKTLQKLHKNIGDTYALINSIQTGGQEEAELTEKLTDLRTERRRSIRRNLM
jgi:hypothetical protein